jgi:TATA-binding protein-associated factor Taf7
MAPASMNKVEPIALWTNDSNDPGTALLEPEHLDKTQPGGSENIAVCDIDDDLDDDEAYFLDDDDDEDDDYSDDYDDDDFDDDDIESDSDDDYDDEDL